MVMVTGIVCYTDYNYANKQVFPIVPRIHFNNCSVVVTYYGCRTPHLKFDKRNPVGFCPPTI